MFNTKKLIEIAKHKRSQQGLLISASVASLVASGNTQAPTSSDTVSIGSATQGTELQVSAASLGLNIEPTDISYQWLSDATNVGENSPRYTPTNDDVNKAVSVVMTYKDSVGNNVLVSSNAVKIANINDAPTGAVDIGNTATAGKELTVNSDILVDIDGLGILHYQWKVGGENVGADAATYTPTNDNIGKTISVEVSYVDVYGASEYVTTNEIASISKADETSNGGGPTTSLTKVGDDFLINQVNIGRQYDASFATLANGNYVMTWSTSEGAPAGGGTGTQLDVKAQIFDVNGVRVGAEFIVNSEMAYDQVGSYVVALKDGGFAIGWTSSGLGTAFNPGRHVQVQVFSDSGQKMGQEFEVETSLTGERRIQSMTALDDGGFLLTWEGVQDSSWASMAQKFDASGATDGNEFIISTITTDDQRQSKVSQLDNGNLVFIWNSADDQSLDNENAVTTGLNTATENPYQVDFYSSIKAQIMQSDGTIMVSEFLVNSLYNGRQSDPEISSLKGGGFVLAWSSEDDQLADLSVSSVRAQIYDATGNKIGTEFLVNSVHEGAQGSPEIVALDDGGFVVLWSGKDPDNTSPFDYAIKGQRFDAKGELVDDEFYIADASQGVQVRSSIGLLSDGKILSVWDTTSPTSQSTDETGIRGQLYEIANTPAAKIAAEQSVNFDALNIQDNLPFEAIYAAPIVEPEITELNILPDHFDYS